MTTIITKNSSTAGAVPTASDLVQGELAVNVTDTGLYTENASGTVVKLNAPSIDDKNTGATKYVTIASGGNVGIGTSSPTSKLTVSGAGAGAWLTLNRTDSGTNIVDFTASGSRIGYVGAIANDISILQSTANNLLFGTNNLERMRIDSSGNVGIGTSSPAAKLDVAGGTGNARFQVSVGSSEVATFAVNNANNAFANLASKAAYHAWYIGASNAMNLDSSGNLLVGATTNTASAKICVEGTQGLSVERSGAGYRNMYMASGVNTLYFYNGTNQASLTSAGAWTNASDGRQKTNISEIKYGLTSVLSSQPRSYNRTDVEGDYIGFIAQELKEVIPEVVFGDEDTQYSVDYGSLIAVAFKAIQEQQAIINNLTERLAALEAK